MSDAHPEFPLKDYLGITIEPGDGRAVAELELTARHVNPNAVAHGAVPFAMMDTAMGAAVMSLLSEGQICATIEMHTRFVRGPSSGRLVATAEVIHPGRKIMHLEATTVDERGKLVASATSSYAVVDVT